MKMLKGSITSLPSEGRCTLQVPDFSICIGDCETEEVPDEWFCRLKDNRLAAGRESGFLFLSPLGWAANKERIKAAWLAAPDKNRGSGMTSNGVKTWEEFETEVAKHFASVKAKTEKHIANLDSQLARLRAALSRT